MVWWLVDHSLPTLIRTLANQRLIRTLEKASKESDKLHGTLLSSGQLNNSRSLFGFVELWQSVVDTYSSDLQSIWTERVDRLIPRLDEAQRSDCVEATLASFDDGCNNIKVRLERVLELVSKRFLSTNSHVNALQHLQPHFDSRRHGLQADLELRLLGHELPAKAENAGASASGHRLAAVVFGDIVGSSARMAVDEEGMAADRKVLLKAVEASAKRHGGRVVNTMGDGFLLEFPSAVDGMSAAMEIQVESTLPLRIGLNVCDVLVAGDDILGDGVNIAKRLESHASTGHICLPEHVARDLVNRFRFAVLDRGEVSFKNISRTIQTAEIDPRAMRIVASSPE